MEDVEGYAYLIENVGGAIGGFFGEVLGALVIAFLVILLVLIIALVLSYVFKTISFVKLSKKNNYKYKWLSWVPLFNNGILTKLAFDKYLIGLLMQIGLLGLFIIGNDNSTINLSGIILLLSYLIIYLFSAYKVYKKYSKYYIILTIISILSFGLTIPFMLFAIRKNNMIEKIMEVKNE